MTALVSGMIVELGGLWPSLHIVDTALDWTVCGIKLGEIGVDPEKQLSGCGRICRDCWTIDRERNTKMDPTTAIKPAPPANTREDRNLRTLLELIGSVGAARESLRVFHEHRLGLTDVELEYLGGGEQGLSDAQTALERIAARLGEIVRFQRAERGLSEALDAGDPADEIETLLEEYHEATRVRDPRILFDEDLEAEASSIVATIYADEIVGERRYEAKIDEELGAL